MSLFSRVRRSIGVREARRRIAAGHVLVDVRGDAEWRSEHVEGARHIPLGELESRLAELPPGTPVVALCHSGVRSLLAAGTLEKHGYSVASVRGGMIAWNRTRE